MKKYLIVSLLSFVLYGQQFDYNQQIKNKPGILNDTIYTSLALACTAANSAHAILSITKAWSGVTTQTINCDVRGGGGYIKPASSQVITFNNIPERCVNLFDVSVGGAGSILFTADNYNRGITPSCFGAVIDGSTNDSIPIQAAIDSVCPWDGSLYNCISTVFLTGNYGVATQINTYSRSTAHTAGFQGYRGFIMRGIAGWKINLNWNGANTFSVIRMIGFKQQLSNFRINITANGVLAAINYDGLSTLGISTSGRIENLFIEGGGFVGDAIELGRGAYQADQITIDHTYITAFQLGSGIRTMDPNSVDNNVYNTTIIHCWIAIRTFTSTNINIFGGSIDNNDVNFWPAAGSQMVITGVRSEGSKRSFFSSAGTYTQPITTINYQLASNYASFNSPVRESSTAAGSASSNDVILSATSVTLGDYITIAGAGSAGGLYHGQMTTMTDTTHGVVQPALSTTVTAGVVLLDATIDQSDWYEGGGGPYNHIGGYFNISTGSLFRAANGPQSLTGVGFLENIPNPFNITLASGVAIPPLASWRGIYTNGASGTQIPDHTNLSYPNKPPIYAVDISVTANLIEIATPLGEQPEKGMIIFVTTANALQAGANNIIVNGHAQIRIYSSFLAVLNNLPGILPAQSLVVLVFDEVGAFRLVGK